jgi:hypothetical protein
MMTAVTPEMIIEPVITTRANDLLESNEKSMVDEYVKYAVGEQLRKRERIFFALFLPIPSEYIRRTRHSLMRPLMRAAIAERIKEEAGAQDISPDRVIAEHAGIAFSNMEDYLELTLNGEVKLKDLNSIGRAKMQAVKSIECKPTMMGMQTKVVLHDKHPSLKALGEMMGLVAPDQPPALAGYATPHKKDAKQVEMAPEKQYIELLQTVGG